MQRDRSVTRSIPVCRTVTTTITVTVTVTVTSTARTGTHPVPAIRMAMETATSTITEAIGATLPDGRVMDRAPTDRARPAR